MHMSKRPEMIELSEQEAVALIDRIRSRNLESCDYRVLEGLVDGFLWLNEVLAEQKISIARLKKLLFGARTESSEALINKSESGGDEVKPGNRLLKAKSKKDDKKAKGHGRNGASSYVGGEKIEVRHSDHQVGDLCPGCGRGKLYELKGRGPVLRIRGSAPIKAKIYSLQKLRCKVCGELFRAALPAEAGEKKYDEAAGAMLGILKYGTGMPFYRLENLQKNIGIPLPASTQWEVIKGVVQDLKPVYEELLYTAAQGEVIHNDDTPAKILALMKENKVYGGDSKGRKGMFTSGILSKVGGHQIALFFSGRNHAGENLEKLLQKRKSSLSPPIQMCDALASNLSQELATILANCLTHARRQFVDVVEVFPEQSIYVIEQFAQVYKHDSIAKEQDMTPRQRLLFHQKESQPIMDNLKKWFKQQFDEKNIEPNSSFGKAIKYMTRHWQELTLFLRVAGAPLDNNILERSLKIAIMNRKNAYFYKTLNGAKTGDIFMSIIQTCRLENVNALDYLIQLQKHTKQVNAHPHKWMPWNYQNTMTQENLT